MSHRSGSVQFRSISSASLLRESAIIMSVVCMMTLLSRVSVPLQPVPVTGQTLGVLLAGMMLGRKRAVAAMVTYLLLGLAGAPVFAGGSLGLAALTGPTAGYLLGFIPAACLMGYLGEKGAYKKAYTALLALCAGHALIFAFGLLWLANFTGWNHVLAAGLIPFLPGAAIKTGLALALQPVLK